MWSFTQFFKVYFYSPDDRSVGWNQNQLPVCTKLEASPVAVFVLLQSERSERTLKKIENADRMLDLKTQVCNRGMHEDHQVPTSVLISGAKKLHQVPTSVLFRRMPEVASIFQFVLNQKRAEKFILHLVYLINIFVSKPSRRWLRERIPLFYPPRPEFVPQ